MRRSPLVFALVLVASLVGACGGGGGSKGASTSYCKQLKASAAEAAATATTTKGPTTSVDYRALQTKFDSALAKLLGKAPSELEDDYKVLQEYFDMYLTALSDPAKADRANISALAPKYQTAQKAITKYNTDVCKFEVTTTAPSGAPSNATTPPTAAK